MLQTTMGEASAALSTKIWSLVVDDSQGMVDDVKLPGFLKGKSAAGWRVRRSPFHIS
jgi:hypothetical protein